MTGMFVFLTKLAPLFVYPLGLIFLLAGAAVFLRKRPALQRGLLITLLVILWVGSIPWTDKALTRSLERKYLPPEPMPRAEVIVVLGGGTQPAQYPRLMPEVGGAGDRVIYAGKLFKEGAAPNLLLSGGSIAWMGERTSPAEEMAQILDLMEIPRDVLWLEENSRNTYENAVESAAILEGKGIKRIILVTSAMHMPRAVEAFEKQGLEVVPAPTDFQVTDQGWGDLWHPTWQALIINLVPDAGNLSSTTGALKEYLGILVYRLRAGL